MIKRILSILLVFQSAIGFGQRLTKAEYLEDLQYLQDTLPKRHINLFAKISQADFNRQMEAIRARLATPDAESFIVELFKLPVAIGDEHTLIEPVFDQVIPVKFQSFKEGYFVTAIDSVYADLLLSQLTGINGHPLDEVITRFKTIIQHENPSFFDARFLVYLNNPVLLKGLGLISNTNDVTFNFKRADGQMVNKVIRSVNAKNTGDLKLLKYGPRPFAHTENAYYWFRYDEQRKTLYFNFNKCREESNRPFAEFNKALFQILKERKPQYLVLDLRENSGGNSGVLSPFIEVFKKSRWNVSGKFFVLIGKATFSSALMNAVTLKRETKAILLGEATSGTVNHYGEVRGFRLPNTKIVIGYSTRFWETWKGHDGPLLPDVQIKYSVKNYAAGVDEAMEYIFK